MSADVAIVSGADAAYFDLLQGLVRSIRDKSQGRDVALYVFDIGLNEAQRRWLLTQGVKLHSPQGGPYRDDWPNVAGTATADYLRAFLARCRIPELFPGHDVYVWIDADAWIQRWDALSSYVENALRIGFAITPESDPAYDRATIMKANEASFAIFGLEYLDRLHATGTANAGAFAGRADAPHWHAWRRSIEANIDKAKGSSHLLFMLDQTALCITCMHSDLQAALMPTTCNWVSHLGLPMVSEDGGMLLRPLPPHEALGIVHQTNVTKRVFIPLRCVAGGALSRTLGYQAHSQVAADEYVSPGLQVVFPDQYFPNMVRGDEAANGWKYLRRGLPHASLVDRRLPSMGFLNRDEAHILYNLALRFRGKHALEIGCLLGWSTCHIALAGLEVDTIDPILANQHVRASVQSFLRASRLPGRVALIAGSSPATVHEWAKTHQHGWSLFFIDGDHEGDAPLQDAIACLSYAAPDCAMLFHGLVSPNVTNAVMHLKAQGWKIRVYHTAQIMAVAWRGSVRPIAHQPDPRIDWQIPDHVMPLLV